MRLICRDYQIAHSKLCSPSDVQVSALKRITASLSKYELNFAAAEPPFKAPPIQKTLICASFPGQVLSPNPIAREISSYIPIFVSDPFIPRWNHAKRIQALLYLSHLARSLFVAHSAVQVFLVILFPRMTPKAHVTRDTDTVNSSSDMSARIIRFDRVSAIISQAFLCDDGPTDTLRQFFWKFCYPTSRFLGDRIVYGSDLSVRRPTDLDIAWAKSMLRPDEEWSDDDMHASRWFRIKLFASSESGAAKHGNFLALRTLFVSKHLFGRGTIIWECLRRGDVNGKRYVVKDAWPVCLELDASSRGYGELECYERIMSCIHSDGDAIGLANAIAAQRGHDEGKDVQERDDDETYIDEEQDWLWVDKTPASSPSIREDSPSDAAESGYTSSMCGVNVNSAVYALSQGNEISDRKTFMPNCFSSSSVGHLKQRAHLRLVLDILGRPLPSFKTTKEMVTAIRDAVLGKTHSANIHRGF